MADTAAYDAGAALPVDIWKAVVGSDSTESDPPAMDVWKLQDEMATYEPPIYSSLTVDIGGVDGGRRNPLCPRANP